MGIDPGAGGIDENKIRERVDIDVVDLRGVFWRAGRGQLARRFRTGVEESDSCARAGY